MRPVPEHVYLVICHRCARQQVARTRTLVQAADALGRIGWTSVKGHNVCPSCVRGE